MKLLALDTATEACAAAIWNDGEVVERLVMSRQHAERLLEQVQELLAEAGLALAQLDAIAFGRGPGMFTGLRIGAGITQGLAFGAGLPVIPVSSLAALAQAQVADRVLAAFDARMGQIYWGNYRRDNAGLMQAVGAERVDAPGEITTPSGDQWVGAGSGWDQYADAMLAAVNGRIDHWNPRRFPSGRAIAELGETAFRDGRALPPEQAIPVYIRDDVASPNIAPGARPLPPPKKSK